ncbi:MAG: protein kinase [Gemmatimonadetes bacterium]|nr:protein kinase [Gemmatimonadota bacterium]
MRLPEFPTTCTLTPVDRPSGADHPGGVLAPSDLLSTVREALQDRYAVAGEIGRGGMAVVCRATDLRHGREVAIKVLLPELARAVTGDRFLREISILARLSHPSILPLLDSGTVEVVPGLDVPWYVMPYVAEDTLRARLEREGPLPVDQALHLTRELCGALTHAHRQGIIHRDIKPENILLSGGRAVLADFGIARAVTLSGTSSLSSTGLVIGTPAYMSPEQSAGSEKLDARSDLYSLGVVLYEMLAGQPPFTGATPQAISARHQFETPPPIRVVRPTIPVGVEAVLSRVLEKVPADRYESAEALGRALEGAPTGAGRTVTPTAEVLPSRRQGLRARWLVAGGVAVGLGIAAVVAARPGGLLGPAYDPEQVVVLPFKGQDPGLDSVLSGEDIGRLVYDGLDGFRDLHRVEPLVVSDAIARAGRPATVEASRAMARRLGAGRFIWGEVTRAGDSIRVRGLLFDSRGGSTEPVKRRNATLPLAIASVGSSGLMDELSRMALGLVVPEGDSLPLPARPGTSSLEALQHALRGEAAFQSWDLDAARASFGAALRLDPAFPRANLRLAQIGQWVRDSATAWRPFLTIAEQAEDGLTTGERLAARGLRFLADSAYPQACEAYRRLLASDSLDFVGWFGLGECHLWDEEVLPGHGGAGLVFRGSYAEAQRAYLRALAAVPLAHRAAREVVIPRLFLVLPTSTWLRPGRRGSTYYSAWVDWQADTIAFRPLPTVDLTSGKAEGPPQSGAKAFAHSRQVLRTVVDEWVRLYPGSGPAWTARAAVLERLLVLQGDSSAVAAVARALDLTTDSAARARLMIDQARLALKTGDFALAGSAARAVLDTWRPSTPADALRLAPLAALVGRTAQLVALLRQGASAWEFATPDGTPVHPPQSLAAEALTLYAYAVMGSSADSVQSQEARVLRLIDGWAPRQEQNAMILALTEDAAFYAFATTGPLTAHQTPGHNSSLEPQSAHSRGRSAVVRDAVARWSRAAETSDAGEVAPESALAQSNLCLLIADTATALQVAARAISGIELQDHLLLLPQAAGSLRRLLSLIYAAGQQQDPAAAMRADAILSQLRPAE